ncbi:PQQ-dependent sugar dehydrogenase [Roseovarius salinarum]|uniref:PQQ-dependent sugar dehydrogenase n=1 Tax=Roseovarius salinarum TaxID=1981892 RepID=UPI000C33E7D9|nr:PQQ-dependent sugar dehydrogenase [Roseovarius salinarum]
MTRIARNLALALVAAVALGAAPAGAASLQTAAGPVQVTRVADGLTEPWAIGFLPDASILVTERGGRLLRLTQDGRHAIDGVPPVAAVGQGGLLDVLVPRDFEQTRELVFTYARRQNGGAGTAVARARLAEDTRRLTDWRVIWEMTPGTRGGRHFGSRVVEAPDGNLFVTVGERGDRPSAQDLGRANGSVLRIARDGSIPPGNPFADRTNALDAIWSYGHRNPQGAALDLSGKLWVVEHGARGGDEINRVRRGANYGWPVIAYGTHYSGAKIGVGTHKEGMEQPDFYWDPSIAPSGMIIYSGKLWPEWKGHFLVGSLKFDHISHLAGRPLEEIERISGPQTGRVRDIAEGPEGGIWFLSVDTGALYRMTP